jgi:hypothetical protein
VDRRQEARTQVDAQAAVTVLGGAKVEPLKARMTDLSGRGMRLMLPAPVSAGTAILIESGDTHFLGEVAYCGQMAGGWVVGVEVDQQFRDTVALQNLRRAVCETGALQTVRPGKPD